MATSGSARWSKLTSPCPVAAISTSLPRKARHSSAAEHDAANQIEDDVRAFSSGRRPNFRRQVLGADDRLLCYGANRRVRSRRAPVGTDHPGAKASRDLGGGAADAASGADQEHDLPGLQARRFDAAPGGIVVDSNRRGLVEA
jgi:hypothetical protein